MSACACACVCVCVRRGEGSKWLKIPELLEHRERERIVKEGLRDRQGPEGKEEESIQAFLFYLKQ